ncbi:MAG: hypothetical protein ACT4PG_00075 [Panacagrimonas sp.]
MNAPRLLLAAWCIASPVTAMDVQLQIGSIQLAGIEDPIRDLRVDARLKVQDDALRLRSTQLRAHWKPLGKISAQLDGEARSSAHWTLRLRQLRTQAGTLRADITQRDANLQLNAASAGLNLAALMPALAALQAPPLSLSGALSGSLSARRRAQNWSLQTQLDLKALTASEDSGRYASEKLDARVLAQVQSTPTQWRGKASLHLPQGQAYIEPVFVDFGLAAAEASTEFKFSKTDSSLHLHTFSLQQHGLGRFSGEARVQPADGLGSLDARVQWQDLQLVSAFSTYAQPFLAGKALEQLAPSGQSSGQAQIVKGAPHVLHVQLAQGGIEMADTGLSGIDASLHWARNAPVEQSSLRWSGGHLADLKLGGGDTAFSAQAANFTLTRGLRVPLADGALRVDRLALQNIGSATLAARFEAEIEPIDLAALCRAFGWPEFSGQLGGKLPGLRLRDNTLELDGALSARAFDGEVSVEQLRVLDVLGRVPRISADIRMRRLDLAALTGAFSFGRIEGRLDADVEDLRLLDWQPVAFKASLRSTPGDASRQRISQRAIDNLSALGGGPSGVLSRGALRFFDDFAYARIGWRCVLANGVCHMDGVEPAANGGYVLVKGRWLPRIDVVGYNREVDWNTFLAQLKSARQSDGVQLR